MKRSTSRLLTLFLRLLLAVPGGALTVRGRAPAQAHAPYCGIRWGSLPEPRPWAPPVRWWTSAPAATPASTGSCSTWPAGTSGTSSATSTRWSWTVRAPRPAARRRAARGRRHGAGPADGRLVPAERRAGRHHRLPDLPPRGLGRQLRGQTTVGLGSARGCRSGCSPSTGRATGPGWWWTSRTAGDARDGSGRGAGRGAGRGPQARSSTAQPNGSTTSVDPSTATPAREQHPGARHLGHLDLGPPVGRVGHDHVGAAALEDQRVVPDEHARGRGPDPQRRGAAAQREQLADQVQHRAGVGLRGLQVRAGGVGVDRQVERARAARSRSPRPRPASQCIGVRAPARLYVGWTTLPSTSGRPGPVGDADLVAVVDGRHGAPGEQERPRRRGLLDRAGAADQPREVVVGAGQQQRSARGGAPGAPPTRAGTARASRARRRRPSSRPAPTRLGAGAAVVEQRAVHAVDDQGHVAVEGRRAQARRLDALGEDDRARGRPRPASARSSRHSATVATWPGSSLTSEKAMSTRNPATPRSSQNAMISRSAARLASGAGGVDGLLPGLGRVRVGVAEVERGLGVVEVLQVVAGPRAGRGDEALARACPTRRSGPRAGAARRARPAHEARNHSCSSEVCPATRSSSTRMPRSRAASTTATRSSLVP